MRKIIISGCNGHMGRAVARLCALDPDLEVAAGIDILGQPGDGFPVFPSPAACAVQADVLVDFSHPPPWRDCWSSASNNASLRFWPPPVIPRSSWTGSARPPCRFPFSAPPTSPWG